MSIFHIYIGEEVRQEQKANAREIDRLMKAINGCNQALDKMKDHHVDVERQHKEKLKLHDAVLKEVRRELEEFRSDMVEDRGAIARLMEGVGEDMKARQQNVLQQVESNNSNMKSSLKAMAEKLHEEMREVREGAQEVSGQVQQRLAKYDEEVDYMSVMRKEVRLLDRRMDKVVSVVKEMKAHFEFED